MRIEPTLFQFGLACANPIVETAVKISFTTGTAVGAITVGIISDRYVSLHKNSFLPTINFVLVLECKTWSCYKHGKILKSKATFDQI